MWNLQSCNKLITQRSQQRSYQLHRKKIEQMQPRMKLQQPIQPDFVYTKNKLNMSRRDRRVEIDRLNQILLRKMDQIREEEYRVNRLRPEAQNLRSLNVHTMEVMNQQIATENARICNKLMRTKSFYPTTNILEKTDHLDYISANISFNARRANSMRNLHSASQSRPRSSYTTNLSSQKRRSKQNFASTSSQMNRKLFKTERPETAPMSMRPNKIIVPQSGRPRIQSHRQQGQEGL